MANVEFRYAPGPTARYLDDSPMISALRVQPDDSSSSTTGGTRASGHRFHFDKMGRVTIEAQCSCASMSVKPEQTDEPVSMFRTWRSEYWMPLDQNREFASHFGKPSAWARLFRDERMAFRWFLRQEAPTSIPATRPSIARRPRHSKRIGQCRRCYSCGRAEAGIRKLRFLLA